LICWGAGTRAKGHANAAGNGTKGSAAHQTGGTTSTRHNGHCWNALCEGVEGGHRIGQHSLPRLKQTNLPRAVESSHALSHFGRRSILLGADGVTGGLFGHVLVGHDAESVAKHARVTADVEGAAGQCRTYCTQGISDTFAYTSGTGGTEDICIRKFLRTEDIIIGKFRHQGATQPVPVQR
jgi:hypothetical protein